MTVVAVTVVVVVVVVESRSPLTVGMSGLSFLLLLPDTTVVRFYKIFFLNRHQSVPWKRDRPNNHSSVDFRKRQTIAGFGCGGAR
jgi:hypothetical protein